MSTVDVYLVSIQLFYPCCNSGFSVNGTAFRVAQERMGCQDDRVAQATAARVEREDLRGNLVCQGSQ